MAVNNEELSELVIAEAESWAKSEDIDQLRDLYSQRITAVSHNLTEKQAKAVGVVQAGAYVIAFNMMINKMIYETAVQVKQLIRQTDNGAHLLGDDEERGVA